MTGSTAEITLLKNIMKYNFLSVCHEFCSLLLYHIFPLVVLIPMIPHLIRYTLEDVASGSRSAVSALCSVWGCRLQSCHHHPVN